MYVKYMNINKLQTCREHFGKKTFYKLDTRYIFTTIVRCVMATCCNKLIQRDTDNSICCHPNYYKDIQTHSYRCLSTAIVF
jgi:hypothetical protein